MIIVIIVAAVVVRMVHTTLTSVLPSFLYFLHLCFLLPLLFLKIWYKHSVGG